MQGIPRWPKNLDLPKDNGVASFHLDWTQAATSNQKAKYQAPLPQQLFFILIWVRSTFTDKYFSRTVRPFGRTVRPFGRTNGRTVRPNGCTVRPNGHTVRPNGHTVRPNGRTVRPNGRTVRPNGRTSAREKYSEPRLLFLVKEGRGPQLAPDIGGRVEASWLYFFFRVKAFKT